MSYLYKSKDDLLITKELGDLDYYIETLRDIVKQYDLSNKTDFVELQQIGKEIYDYMFTEKFRAALPYPKSPNISLWYSIIDIAKFISNMSQENMNTEDSYKKFCMEILKRLDDADHDYFWDIRTR